MHTTLALVFAGLIQILFGSKWDKSHSSEEINNSLLECSFKSILYNTLNGGQVLLLKVYLNFGHSCFQNLLRTKVCEQNGVMLVLDQKKGWPYFNENHVSL